MKRTKQVKINKRKTQNEQTHNRHRLKSWMISFYVVEFWNYGCQLVWETKIGTNRHVKWKYFKSEDIFKAERLRVALLKKWNPVMERGRERHVLKRFPFVSVLNLWHDLFTKWETREVKTHDVITAVFSDNDVS